MSGQAPRTRLAQVPLVGSLATFLYRGAIAARHAASASATAVRWWLSSSETSNFTYDLTPINKQHLAAAVAEATAVSFDVIAGYIRELDGDEALRAHIRAAVRPRRDQRPVDHAVHYGRRLGWYAIARAVKPSVIVETGVDKGMGSCVLTSALARNAAEGHDGRYYGLDINPKAGYLLTGELSRFGEILYGDSIETLRKFDRPIDLFINDSDHSADYEMREYETVQSGLSPGAIILGDNAHYTDRLLTFASATNRRFLYFQERPAAHWYPGAGIGIAFPRR